MHRYLERGVGNYKSGICCPWWMRAKREWGVLPIASWAGLTAALVEISSMNWSETCSNLGQVWDGRHALLGCMTLGQL